MDDNRIAYIKEQIEFLKAELNRNIFLSDSELQPEAAMHIEEVRNEMRRKIYELMNQLADPQREERVAQREVQERQYYRGLLEKISADDNALKAAKDIAGQCEEDEYREDIISGAVNRYEDTKLAIAKLLLEKLA